MSATVDFDIAHVYAQIINGLDEASLAGLWMAVLAGRQHDLSDDLRTRAVQLDDLRDKVGMRSAQRARDQKRRAV